LLITLDELEKLKSRETAKIECQYCKNSFFLPKNRVLAALNGQRKDRNKYCSGKCRAQAKIKDKITLNCDNCGIPVSKLQSAINNKNFCSGKCRAKFFANFTRKIKVAKIKPIIQENVPIEGFTPSSKIL